MRDCQKFMIHQYAFNKKRLGLLRSASKVMCKSLFFCEVSTLWIIPSLIYIHFASSTPQRAVGENTLWGCISDLCDITNGWFPEEKKEKEKKGGVLDPANKFHFQHQTHSQSCQSVPVPIFSDGQNFSQRCTNWRRSSTNQEVFTNDSCFTACVCIIIETQHHKVLLPCYYFLLWLFSFAHLLTSCSVMIWTL